FTIKDSCTHAQVTLNDGGIEGGEIISPRPVARFNIKTRQALSPPAYLPVTTYHTRIKGSMVQVCIADSTVSPNCAGDGHDVQELEN
ncbi:MAG: 3-phenylpropionate/trans-cinnamate dioxygenase ferredoxin subunit, partial [Gammaproteobacteria bacterium]